MGELQGLVQGQRSVEVSSSPVLKGRREIAMGLPIKTAGAWGLCRRKTSISLVGSGLSLLANGLLLARFDGSRYWIGQCCGQGR